MDKNKDDMSVVTGYIFSNQAVLPKNALVIMIIVSRIIVESCSSYRTVLDFRCFSLQHFLNHVFFSKFGSFLRKKNIPTKP